MYSLLAACCMARASEMYGTFCVSKFYSALCQSSTFGLHKITDDFTFRFWLSCACLRQVSMQAFAPPCRFHGWYRHQWNSNRAYLSLVPPFWAPWIISACSSYQSCASSPSLALFVRVFLRPDVASSSWCGLHWGRKWSWSICFRRRSLLTHPYSAARRRSSSADCQATFSFDRSSRCCAFWLSLLPAAALARFWKWVILWLPLAGRQHGVRPSECLTLTCSAS